MTEPADLRVVDAGQGGQPQAEDRDAWIAAGTALVRDHSEASWQFADWLAAGHRAWGKDAVDAATETTGTSRGKIINYRRASETYPPTRRRVGLTFSHHMEAAFLPDAEREQLLDRAEAGEWSRAEIRAAAREASKDGKLRRQAAEIRALKRALKAAQANALDTTRQARTRLDAERRVIREAAGRSADLVEELADSGVLDDLHGNARRALVKALEQSGGALATEVNKALKRMKAATERIKNSA